MSNTNPQETLNTNASDFRLNRFEAIWMAWRGDVPMPDWRQHLPADDEPCNADWLFFLLQIDIEFRIKAGIAALLAEPYFEHPRLQKADARLDAAMQMELIQWEYQLRLQKGERPQRSEYEVAFPRHVEALRAMKPGSRCPRCGKIFVLDETYQTLLCPHCGSDSPGIDVAQPAAAEAKASVAATELDARFYALMDTLGTGGMGEVYRCNDPALGRDLAIKVMKAELQNHPKCERRFLREARITGSLQHPSIVAVHNLGRLVDGRLHYTMRLVRGKTFADILKEEAGKPKRLPYLLSIFEKICQAVAYAHSKRVIHRDLKPKNVMVGKFGEVQVMDWGLAKVLTTNNAANADEEPDDGGTRMPLESSDTPVDLTRMGSGFGTPAYMPPEQALGEWNAVDERADVFALGSILCEILTGEAAYSGTDGKEVYHQARRGNVASALHRLEKANPDPLLMDLCLQCLSYERESRPRDAGIVADRVNAYQTEVEERLRRAELERVLAQARAREEQTRLEAEEERTREALTRFAGERRAKRRLLLLSAAVVVTVAAASVLVGQAANKANEAKNQALALAETNTNLAKEKGDLAEKEINARERAENAQRAAEAETRKARTVATFLGGIFEASDPMGLTSQSIIFPRVAGEKLSGQDLLERGAKKCERELREEPELQAVVLTTIGNAYVNLGEYEKGKPLLEQALRLAEQRKDNRREIADIQHSLGSLYHARGDYEAAEKLYYSALKLREEAQPVNRLLIADTLFNLGWLLTEKEEHKEAEKCYKRCLELRTKILRKDDRLVAFCQVGLAAIYLDRNENYLQAWALISQSIQTFLRIEGNTSSLAKAMGRFQEGIMLLHGSTRLPLMNAVWSNPREKGVEKLKECLKILKSSPLGPNHIYVAFVAGTLALELSRTSEDDRAKPYFEECLRVVEGQVGLWHPKLDKVIFAYAGLLIRQGKKQEADRLYESVRKARELRFGKNHLQVANAIVGHALFKDKYASENKELLLQARRIYEREQPIKGLTSAHLYINCINQLGVIALDVERDVAKAEKIFREAWEINRGFSVIRPVDSANFRINHANALIQLHKYAKAEAILSEVRTVCESEGPIAHELLKADFNMLMQLYLAQGRHAECAKLSLERSKLWANDPDQLYTAGRDLLDCVPLVGRGKPSLSPADQKERQHYLEQGIASYRKAIDLYRKAGVLKYPWYKFCLNSLARALYDSQRPGDAEKYLEESLQLCRKDLGDRNAEIAFALILRAQIRMAQRKYEGVEENLREAEEVLIELPMNQMNIFGMRIQNERKFILELLQLLYNGSGRNPIEAVCLYDEIVSRRKSILGHDNADTLSSQLHLANAYSAMGRSADAIDVLEPTLTKMTPSSGSNHSESLVAMNNLAVAYWSNRRYDDALRLHKLLLEKRKTQFGLDHPDTLLTMANLGVTYRDMGKMKHAVPLLEEAIERGRKQPGGLPMQIAWVPFSLAETYEQNGDFAKSESYYRSFIEQGKKQFGAEDPRTVGHMALLGLNLIRQHKYSEGEALLRDCLKIREAKQPDEWTTFNTRSLLGETLLRQKKFTEAEPLLVVGYEGMKQRETKIPPPFNTVRLSEALERLVLLYEATKSNEKAEQWRKKLHDLRQPKK